MWRETLPTLSDVITGLFLGDGTALPRPSLSLQTQEILLKNPSPARVKNNENKRESIETKYFSLLVHYSMLPPHTHTFTKVRLLVGQRQMSLR